MRCRPQAEFLRTHASLLNETKSQPDALLFLPFRRWLDTADCQPLKIARALSSTNIQFEVVCEDDLAKRLEGTPRPVLLVESEGVLTALETAAVDEFKRNGGSVVWTKGDNWFAEYQTAAGAPSVIVDGPKTIRAVVRDQPGKRIVHLLNLNLQRLSSFEDKIEPAADVQLKVLVPFAPRSVTAISADREAHRGRCNSHR